MFENQEINISKELWASIINDPDIIGEKSLSILKYLHSCPRFESTGKMTAIALGYKHHAPLNRIIPTFSKKILKKHTSVKIPERDDGTKRLWHIPFLGSEEPGGFNWILRPELVEALDDRFSSRNEEDSFENEERENQIHLEGTITTVTLNRYERSRGARRRCLERHGYVCVTCGFDFEKKYGPIGKGKIQVHHKTPISNIGKEYVVDAINDLAPVCANCHMIIHSKSTPFTIEELKKIIMERLQDS